MSRKPRSGAGYRGGARCAEMCSSAPARRPPRRQCSRHGQPAGTWLSDRPLENSAPVADPIAALGLFDLEKTPPPHFLRWRNRLLSARGATEDHAAVLKRGPFCRDFFAPSGPKTGSKASDTFDALFEHFLEQKRVVFLTALPALQRGIAPPQVSHFRFGAISRPTSATAAAISNCCLCLRSHSTLQHRRPRE